MKTADPAFKVLLLAMCGNGMSRVFFFLFASFLGQEG